MMRIIQKRLKINALCFYLVLAYVVMLIDIVVVTSKKIKFSYSTILYVG